MTISAEELQKMVNKIAQCSNMNDVIYVLGTNEFSALPSNVQEAIVQSGLPYRQIKQYIEDSYFDDKIYVMNESEMLRIGNDYIYELTQSKEYT